MNDEHAPWQYKPDDDAALAPDEPVGGHEARHRPKAHAAVTWQAPEFIEHHHGPGWYAGLTAITAGLAAAVYFALRDYFATGVIAAAGIIVGIYAKHKPAQAKCELTASGLTINGKNYPYSSYKSFTIQREGSLNSFNLLPLKRFMPPLAAYFDPEDETKIAEVLGEHLPLEERRTDTIDKISRRLRL